MNDPKRVVVAVDGSDNAWRAVEYVAAMLGGVPGVQVCVLLVERLPSRDLFASQVAWEATCQVHRERARAFVDRCRQRLEAANLAVETVVINSCAAVENEAGAVCSLGTSIARDIIAFQEQGQYGTVVVGRRGVSRAEEFLFGSVTTKVTHLARNCAVWVVQ
ncbi:MAG: universal stress protein [Desulfomicrobiaceae bacterium]|jgi:nucleotide-binding universal stress UspA family protein